jgi:hypothetical protein
MPVLVTQLPSMLHQISSLCAESTTSVCTDVTNSETYKNVGAKPGKRPITPPKAPTVLSSTPAVSLRPIDVLQTLGLATLPPRHVHQHLASWHWTMLRYAYLIEPKPGGSPFETNLLAGDYKHHHMTALSEAVGVGCSLSYAQRWLAVQLPSDVIVHDPIDFDYLIGVGSVPLPGKAAGLTPQAAPNTRRKPDYLIVAERDDGFVQLLVVECKGTSSGRSTAIGQLGSAMHQLAGVTFAGSAAGPIAIHRHAYAALMTKGGGAVKLFGIDPPEDGDPWVRPSPSTRDEGQPLEARRDEGSLMLPTPEVVSGRYLRRLEDRAFAWAGASAGELDLEAAPRRDSRFGALIGATSSLILPGRRTIKIFTGALVSLLQAAQESDPDKAQQHRLEVRRKLDDGRPLESEGRRLADEDPARVASVINDDGLALRIEVT